MPSPQAGQPGSGPPGPLLGLPAGPLALAIAAAPEDLSLMKSPGLKTKGKSAARHGLRRVPARRLRHRDRDLDIQVRRQTVRGGPWRRSGPAGPRSPGLRQTAYGTDPARPARRAGSCPRRRHRSVTPAAVREAAEHEAARLAAPGMTEPEQP